MKSHHYPRTGNLGRAEHKAIIPALQEYRRHWQQASRDNSLTEVVAPVGLVIADIAASPGLTSVEQRAILGAELNIALVRLLNQRVRLKQ